jgi:hypothetical protein
MTDLCSYLQSTECEVRKDAKNKFGNFMSSKPVHAMTRNSTINWCYHMTLHTTKYFFMKSQKLKPTKYTLFTRKRSPRYRYYNQLFVIQLFINIYVFISPHAILICWHIPYSCFTLLVIITLRLLIIAQEGQNMCEADYRKLQVSPNKVISCFHFRGYINCRFRKMERLILMKTTQYGLFSLY